MARTKQTKRDTPSAAAGPSTRKSPRNLSPRNLSRRRQGENENDTSENESESVASERVSESEPEDDGADDGVSEKGDHDSDAASKTVDVGGGENAMIRVVKSHVHASLLHLLQYTTVDGEVKVLDVNANTLKVEITSEIQNTLAGNPANAPPSQAKKLNNSVMSAVITNKPTDNSTNNGKVTDVSVTQMKFGNCPMCKF